MIITQNSSFVRLSGFFVTVCEESSVYLYVCIHAQIDFARTSYDHRFQKFDLILQAIWKFGFHVYSKVSLCIVVFGG